jgi:hypothetical protein
MNETGSETWGHWWSATGARTTHPPTGIVWYQTIRVVGATGSNSKTVT